MATTGIATLTLRIDHGAKDALRPGAQQEPRPIANTVEVLIGDYCGRTGIQIAERLAADNDKPKSWERG